MAALFWLSLLATATAQDRPDQLNARSVVTSIKGTVYRIWADGTADQIIEQPSLRNEVDIGQGVETGVDGRAVVTETAGRLRVMQMPPLSRVDIVKRATNSLPWVNLLKGKLALISHDLSQTWGFLAGSSHGGTEGTEFELRLEGDTVVLSVYDGIATLANANGRVTIYPMEEGRAEGTNAPTKEGFLARNQVQWWINYPAILSISDLSAAGLASADLRQSLDAWRQGDFWQSVVRQPARPPVTPEEHIFKAANCLVIGDTQKAREVLAGLEESHSAARGLLEMIDALIGNASAENRLPDSSTEWLARSYTRQASHNLKGALAAAEEALFRTNSLGVKTTNGLAWVRLAELEFSFGRLPTARRALAKGSALVPKHPGAEVLAGFLEAARNRDSAATGHFTNALALDSMSGDAWLGNGLLAFRKGQTEMALSNLLTATLLEPQRSTHHSYLGKAFAETGDWTTAEKELAFAHRLDTNDPTPLLHLALVDYGQNRVNRAITNLEASLERNDRRGVYRSQLLLDKDRAVRSTSLARIFQRAGLDEVALRTAARAVADDYASADAHLFLADSFNALRDPARFDLRYETPWFSELLLANLLAPPAAGILTPSLSQQEYERLFVRDGPHLSSLSEARSDGAFRQLATQSGLWGGTAYSVDVEYEHRNDRRTAGRTLNTGLDSTEVTAQIKQQLTELDTLSLWANRVDYRSGDNFSYRDPTKANPNYRLTEDQNPNLFTAWHREWEPGQHTIALAGHIEGNQQLMAQEVREAVRVPAGRTVLVPFDVNYQNQFGVWLGELQQIADWEEFAVVGGVRGQAGEFRADNYLSPVGRAFNPFTTQISEAFHRWTAYVYGTWRPTTNFSLTLGGTAEELEIPSNFRDLPVSSGTRTIRDLLPKAALVWGASPVLTVRGMYSEALGGASIDESYRLEPVQLAGFSQAYRTLIPESEVGSVSGHRLKLAGAAFDLRLGPKTYAGLEGVWRTSDVDRTVGVVANSGSSFFGTNSLENLNYDEQTLLTYLDQLVGDHWSFGASHSIGLNRLDRTQDLPVQGSDGEALQNVLRLQAIYNADNGLFGRVSSIWIWQQDEELGQHHSEQHSSLDCEVGLRFHGRKGQASLGVLNLFDHDYRFAPLGSLPNLPRERVVFVRIGFNL